MPTDRKNRPGAEVILELRCDWACVGDSPTSSTVARVTTLRACMNFDMRHLLPVFNCLCHRGRTSKRPLFMGPELYRRTRRDVKFFLMDEKRRAQRAGRRSFSSRLIII